MIVEQSFAREIAEAMLDAVELVGETQCPAAVIDSSGYVVATRIFDREEAIIIVIPDEDDDAGGTLREIVAYHLAAA